MRLAGAWPRRVTDKGIAGISFAETVSWRELIRERRAAVLPHYPVSVIRNSR
jgi:hypothetical protein